MTSAPEAAMHAPSRKLSSRDLLVHGASAGLLAGLVVALWFLAVDVAAGEPLRTPALLGTAFGLAPETGTLAPVALYTGLHLAVFALLGVAAAVLLASAGLTPGWLVGLLFGLGVANGAFYGALLAVDGAMVGLLAWVHVVAANLVAGLVAMTYLNRRWPERGRIGLEALRDHPLALRGLAVGLAGAVALALWFFLLDIAAGEPFRTPAALGSTLFLGARSPEEIRLTLAVVAGYTAVHLAAFWAVGIALEAVARQVERTPRLIYLLVLAGIILMAASLGVLVVAAHWVLGTLSMWAVGIGNLLAVAAMGAWIWRLHPALRRTVEEEGMRSAA